MRWAALFALLALTADARDRGCRPNRFNRFEDCGALAFFEFAPSNGSGMGTVCAGTTPTGAKGEVLTFTRATAATCTKGTNGLRTTGIANGDLVALTSGQPRVEYDADGVLGLLVEGARTNSQLRSQEIDNAAYIKNGVGAAAPTVTANHATAPDGTATAERVQFAATIATQTSSVYQTACPTGATTASAYVRGTSGSGTIRVILDQGGTFVCGACSFVADSWTRCSVSGTVAASGTFIWGNDSRAGLCGTGSMDAADALVWGAQCEAGAFASSYVPTTSAAVTRNGELASVAIPSHTMTAPFSFAGTVTLPSGLNTNARAHGSVGSAALAAYMDSYLSAGVWFVDSTQVTPNAYNTTIATAANATVRAATYHDGTTFNGCLNSVCGAGVARAWTPLASVVLVRVGQYDTTNGSTFGINSRVCYQTDSSTRCR